ncbi:MAG: tRNA pseudouridine(13) synthase TruD [Myxococcales bacterium]|nr:tRNA pseudouridine(13) synthase TruD [Myxococcales bacterium]
MSDTYHLNADPTWLTTTPGVGGQIKTSPEDFVVIEEGGPEASGRGDHWLVRVQKRNVTTPFAMKQLARALDISDRDIGYAGMKDKLALTTQQLTLPAKSVTAAQLAAIRIPDIEVLDAKLHSTKLRLGHLAGNRFVIAVRGLADADAALAHASRALAELAAPPGVPNWFGGQRFGSDLDNHIVARDMLTGALPWPLDRRKARFFASSLQSHWFNAWLRARLADGLFATVLGGDWLKKHAGGQFTAEDAIAETARLRGDELAIMGPMFGAEMRPSPPGSDAAGREAAILAAADVTPTNLLAMARHAPGARRPSSFALRQASARHLAPDAIELSFWLPSGAYATVVMAEVQKPARAALDSLRGESNDESNA